MGSIFSLFSAELSGGFSGCGRGAVCLEGCSGRAEGVQEASRRERGWEVQSRSAPRGRVGPQAPAWPVLALSSVPAAALPLLPSALIARSSPSCCLCFGPVPEA